MRLNQPSIGMHADFHRKNFRRAAKSRIAREQQSVCSTPHRSNLRRAVKVCLKWKVSGG
jgi:hypothetical protein